MCCVAATFFQDGAAAMARGIEAEQQVEAMERAAGLGGDGGLRVAEARAERFARLGMSKH